ncbi:Transcriptional repressor ctcf-like [Mycena venus]|uniref:Transcriptional repressor ctcf-like n=1 Tax=Mycena venus TaxID=2733690 RepID=A0A8H6XKU7_9AGAR|nr:Transcriptional repressor ctcf-like [Mycena venus]
MARAKNQRFRAKARRIPSPRRPRRATSSVPVPGCPWSFDRPGDLDRHEFTHLSDEEKRRRMFHCTYAGCGHMTRQKSNLETHLRTHTGEKNDRCPDCEYATGDPASLTTHRKEHGYQPRRKGQSKAKRNNRRSATVPAAATAPSTAANNAYPTSIWPSPSSSSSSSPSPSAPSSSSLAASPASMYSDLSMQSQSWSASSTSASPSSFDSESHPSSESPTSGYLPNYAPNYNYPSGYGNGIHPQSQSAYAYAAAVTAVLPVYNYTAQIPTQPLAMTMTFDCNAYASSSIPFDGCSLAATEVSPTVRPGPTLLHPAQKTKLTALHGDVAEASRSRGSQVQAVGPSVETFAYYTLEYTTLVSAGCALEAELELEGDAFKFDFEPAVPAPGGFSLELEDPASYHADGELKSNGHMIFSSEWEDFLP